MVNWNYERGGNTFDLSTRTLATDLPNQTKYKISIGGGQTIELDTALTYKAAAQIRGEASNILAKKTKYTAQKIAAGKAPAVAEAEAQKEAETKVKDFMTDNERFLYNESVDIIQDIFPTNLGGLENIVTKIQDQTKKYEKKIITNKKAIHQLQQR